MRRKTNHLIQKILLVMGIPAMVFFSSCSDPKPETSDDQVSITGAEEVPVAESPADADPMKNKGVGPVTSVEVGETIDQQLAEKGKTIFESKCSACHKFDSKYVGPSLGGVTNRRSPEWIMNMILNPVEMTQKDPLAKSLLEEHLTQMTFQDLTQDDARAILEYFRAVDNPSK